MELTRRNFLKLLAGVSAVLGLGKVDSTPTAAGQVWEYDEYHSDYGVGILNIDPDKAEESHTALAWLNTPTFTPGVTGLTAGNEGDTPATVSICRGKTPISTISVGPGELLTFFPSVPIVVGDTFDSSIIIKCDPPDARVMIEVSYVTERGRHTMRERWPAEWRG